MASKINKGLKRTALSVALGMCFASSLVLAQSSVGSVFGSAKGGATVTIENPSTGAKREMTADAGGRFSFSQLAPGNYKITSDGVTRNVNVRVGTGSQVDLSVGQAANIGEVTVVGGGAINPIDVSSVESSTVFSAAQIQVLPVGRDPSAVALLAPGTVKGDSGLGGGKLASFGGASVAENGYYINGFDVTNLHTLLSYATLPFDAISEEQIKTGGYGAEYGRSLGGVISLVTKSGTNDWHAGASIYVTPGRYGRDPSVGNYDSTGAFLGNSVPGQNSSKEFDIWMSGPIIQDRLFIFAEISGQDNSGDSYGQAISTKSSNTTPHGIIKLNWNINDSNVLEFTAISNKEKTTSYLYQSASDYSSTHDGVGARSTFESGGEVYIGKYTGYLTDNLTLSVQYGQVKNLTGRTSSADTAAALCPAVYTTPGLTYAGCWDQNHFTVLDPFAPDNTDKRKAGRIDLEWVLGDHTIRAGYDTAKVVSTNAGVTYSGGAYYRYRISTGTVNGVAVAAGTHYVRKRFFSSPSGSYSTEDTAFYLEDSWHVSDNWTLYGGLRREAFDNKNAAGASFIKATDLWAPRLGFSWDVNGDSTLKVFGNAGRYYIPVANNTNIRASGAETFWQEFYLYTAVDPTTAAPTLGTQIGTRDTVTAGTTPDPSTVADANLSPMYQDEFIAGFQKDFGNGWTGGMRAIYRSVGSGMDDYCDWHAFYNYAHATGHLNYDPATAAGCFILNPGKDVTASLDLDNTGVYTLNHVAASYFNLPKYKRDYKALEFFWEKQSDKWAMQGSYTWSRSTGNVEGYVNSTLNQEDAGLTQDFDFASFENGSQGYLPNDRTHVIKAFGTYSINDQWRIGGNLVVESGRPRSCQGFVPTTVPDYGHDPNGVGGSGSYTSASSFYCLGVLTQRGSLGRTPWVKNLNAQIAYMPQITDGKLTLEVDVYNVFNSHTVTEYNEVKDAVKGDLTTVNPNYGLPSSYQAPRSVQFVVRFEY